MSKLAAYNFLAEYLGSDTFTSEIELDNAIEAINLPSIAKYIDKADKRCIPTYWYSVFDIDKQEVIATNWISRHGFEIFKIADDKVIEHYRRPVGSENVFISLDINTHQIIEYYKMVGIDLVKFDSKTNERLGHTTDCTYDTLPPEYKELVNKDAQLVYWADKPYGRVVGIIEV